MKRIKLAFRQLPCYTAAEECMNTVTHITGGSLGIIMALLCILRSSFNGCLTSLICSSVYGFSLIAVYCISSIYHGLHPGMGKKVFQVLDHCMIYLLIAGTYTPILVLGFMPRYPYIGWGLLIFQWGLAALAATLTAIDLRKYKVFSMLCYILLGWAIFPFIQQAITVLGREGFMLLLAGGISYTVGAILFGMGTKIRWMHSVFHIFVVIGSVLHFLSIYLYVL